MNESSLLLNLFIILLVASAVAGLGVYTQNTQIMKLVALFSLALPCAGAVLFHENPVAASYTSVMGLSVIAACGISVFLINERSPQAEPADTTAEDGQEENCS